MDTTILIFALALLGIILMICHKAVELRMGRSVLFANLRKRADEVASGWHGSALEKFEFFTKENLKTVGRLVYVLCYRAVRGIKRRAQALYAKFHHEMKEKSVLKNQGSPSFFLKNVSEYKDKLVQ